MLLRLYPVVLLLLLLPPARAQGQGILLSEYRLQIDPTKITTLQVCNPTTTPRVVSLSLQDKGLDRYGRMIHYPDSVCPPFSLRNHLRFFPRWVRIEPGKCQEVQLQAKGVAQLPDGEYRVYLVFAPKDIDDPTPDTAPQPEAAADQGVGMNIDIRVAAAIPIMLRKHARLEGLHIAHITLSLDSLDPSHYQLHLTLAKQGNRSVYGKLRLGWTTTGQPPLVIETPPEVVYAEMHHKQIRIPLPTDTLAPYLHQHPQGQLQIQYIDLEAPLYPKPHILADTLLLVPYLTPR